MKRASFSLALLVAVLALSSCQSLDDFVVINRSGGPVEVAYVFMREKSGDVRVEEPKVMAADNLEKNERPWEPAPREAYKIDSQSGRVTVKLAPGRVLLLKRAVGYREDSEYADADFGISSITLTGALGVVKLEGRQARTHFRDEEGCHALIYE